MIVGRSTLEAERGRIFREAWISGVKKYYPGEPKPGYIAPWDETPDWERNSAAAVYNQVHAYIDATDGRTDKLTRTQKGHFVALCWIGQIFNHFADPKPVYIADWNDLPLWQQKQMRTSLSALSTRQNRIAADFHGTSMGKSPMQSRAGDENRHGATTVVAAGSGLPAWRHPSQRRRVRRGAGRRTIVRL